MDINHKYRPTYHASVPSGWSNDPNGLVYYKGKTHMFYQHYPYDAKWGIMHWGHFSTEDFIKWDVFPIALKPDKEYEVENGCCSGSAIIIDNRLYLIYTSAQSDLQRQCIAYSDDGFYFHKPLENPIITSTDLSNEIAPKDFRDPYIFKKDDTYYCLIGARMLDEEDKIKYEKEVTLNKESTMVGADVGYVNGYGNIVLCKSKDLKTWEYCGKLLCMQDNVDKEFFTLKGTYECPAYFSLDGYDFILTSPQRLKKKGNKYENLHSNIYLKGHLDLDTGKFDIVEIKELDSGFDFYAPQTLSLPDGRIIMMAWKEMWDRSYPTRDHNWVGTYSLPREMVVNNGVLYQKPITEIKNYYTNKIENKGFTLNNESLSVDGFTGNAVNLKVDIKANDCDRIGLKLLKGDKNETILYYNKKDKTFVIDRSNSGEIISGVEEDVNIRKCDIDEDHIKLDIFIDISCIEVFINDGKYVMSANIYGDTEVDKGIEFFTENGSGEFNNLVKYDIEIK